MPTDVLTSGMLEAMSGGNRVAAWISDSLTARRTTSWQDSRQATQDRRILIVDDEPLNIKLIQKQLTGAGYTHISTTTQPTQVIPLLHQQDTDVVLLDIVMPGLDGLTILKEIRGDASLGHLPVIMVTAANDLETMAQALDLGATDFLDKPVHPTQLLPRVRNALTVKSHHDNLRHWAEAMEQEVERRTAELEASRLELIYCLGRAAEFRDNETGMHIIRVGRYVGLIARQLGLDERAAFLLAQTAQLHDMGKIGIPDAILLKPGKLTPSEYDLMRQHSEIGKQTLSPFTADEMARFMDHTMVGKEILSGGESPLLRMAARIALTHHEKWDGTGYPLGLKGEDIPIEGRITAVADVFDALSSVRPYKQAFSLDRCFAMMEAERDKHFDPRVLDAFFACKEDVVRICAEYSDTGAATPGRYRQATPGSA